jgi:hypothetical protein
MEGDCFSGCFRCSSHIKTITGLFLSRCKWINIRPRLLSKTTFWSQFHPSWYFCQQIGVEIDLQSISIYLSKFRCHFQQYFSNIVAVSFLGGGNQSTGRKPSTCRKSLTNFITLSCIEYTSLWTGFELTTLVEIGTDCTCTGNNNIKHRIGRFVDISNSHQNIFTT